jgi:uncharacterized protein YidB (DUF937 family)
MGLMDMLGGLMGGGKGKTGNPLADALLGGLMGKGKGAAGLGALAGMGGLGGLMSKFDSAGMGDKAKSWVGTGANEAVSGDEVEQAMGSDAIGQLAKKTGMNTGQVKDGLAGMLPGLVDKVTPGGKLPTGGIGSLLKGLKL